MSDFWKMWVHKGSALKFSTRAASPTGHAPRNSTYSLLKEGYTATYWWFYTRWFLIYFPLLFRPHVIPSCHLVAAPLASASRCKGELLRLLHSCAIAFSFDNTHTCAASLAGGRHTWLYFISPFSIPLFICLFFPLHLWAARPVQLQKRFFSIHL